MKAVFVLVAGVLFLLIGFCNSAHAVTFGYTESFTLNDAGWTGITTTQALDHHLAGGADNAGYVAIKPANAAPPINFMSANGAIVFRADPADSGGSFAGNWLDAGVSTVQAYLRHNFDQFPIEFYVRLTNGPAAVFFADQTVAASDDWQLVNFEISPANLTFAGGTFDGVLSNVQNFQIGARIQGVVANPGEPTLLFDVDQVSLVPEPASVFIAMAAAVFGLTWRRTRVG
jgi:hypothetical protein